MKRVIASAGLVLSLLIGYSIHAHNGKLPSNPQKHFRLNPSFKEGINYVGGHIIFKVKEQYRGNCTVSYINEQKLTPILNILGVTNLAKIYPNQTPPKEKYNKLGQAYADLSLTYEIIYANKIPLEKAINLFLSTGLFDYVDPRYIRHTSVFMPNDPNASASGTNQYNYLNRIKAYNAWDTTAGGTHGDTNVVIGIVDSGSDLVHIDLKANIKHNYADPINGVDDDLDGYIDNFTGWDCAGIDYNHIVGDNDPQIMGSNNEHGSHVSGDAAASTNNGIGVAGVGFKCKFLPVKCAADNDTRGSGGEGYIITGDQGIQYAADHGANVINCSWGGAGYSSYEQSIITYASINKNAIVVVAAGNNGADEISYPAGYNYALSIAATNATNDLVTSFSNYNYSVDLSAPGYGIYNTIYSSTSSVTPGSYASLSGTSMATPITSGGVALVLSKYPSYTGLQAGQRIVVTTDNNYSVNGSIYANKIGSGRLNLYNAVTSTVAAQSESVVFTNDSITDHNDLIFTQGDTVFISGNFINYLNATTSAATATITAISGGTYVTALNSSFGLGVMASNTSKTNVVTPFKFKVNPSAPQNSTVIFQVKITDGAYTQSYFITIPLNPDYVNITINDVHTTITSKGKIGWDLDGEVGGLGFAYNGDELLYEGGLMIGTSTTSIADCIRGTSSTGASDTNFSTFITAHKATPSIVSQFDVNGEFKTNSTVALPLTIRHNAYAWTSPGSLKFVIVEYIIHNTGASTLNNLFAGIFADWDIDASTATENKSAYDSFRGMGYSWATPAAGLYAGIRLLTTTAAPNFYGIDNVGTGVGGVNISSSAGFTTADKYITLSTPRLTAGDSTAAGNDVCNVMSSGPFAVAAGDSVKVAFALLAGDNLTDLQTSSDTAYLRYNGSLPFGTGINNFNSLQGFQVYPNPASNNLNFMINSTQTENCTISLINALGQTVKVMPTTIPSNTVYKVSMDVSDLPPGAYMYKAITPSGKSNTGKILIGH